MIEAPDTMLETLIRLAAAVGFAAIVGWDREREGRAAGLRTHMMVALGSAGFFIVGLQITENLNVNGPPLEFDLMRVVAGLIGGIGFLGAGAIIQSGGRVRGLTTAAGLWTCAAVGLAAGAALYETAALVAFISLVILMLAGFVERALPYRKQKAVPTEAPKKDEERTL
jgi:putative Mg2+ transporter-C (MgtC) family protein